jgi:uncharacterized membrane protein
MSPIPPPEVLERYNVVVAPDAADRILKMAESQMAHRQHLETVAVEGENRRAYVSLFTGPLVILASIAVLPWLAKLGWAGPGVALVFTQVVALTGAFVYGTKSRREEREARHMAQLQRLPRQDQGGSGRPQ